MSQDDWAFSKLTRLSLRLYHIYVMVRVNTKISSADPKCLIHNTLVIVLVPVPELERRIVLLGRPGSGKSATANTLFGRHVFLEARWGRFHTTQCQRAIISRYGRRLEVIDTPGFLLDSDINNSKVKRELVKLIGMSAPGPHIFVFVFPTPHMHKCDVEIFQKFILLFGPDVLDHTILLFSKADDLDYFSLTKQAFILSAPVEWKEIMKACDYRCVWFQNRSPPIDKELMVRTFLETMENTIAKNVGRYFSSDIYTAVEKSILIKDVSETDQNVRLNKLRRKLRINLDAGSKNMYGDTRRNPNRTRSELRSDLENNNSKLIETIWHAIKYFDCLKILRRPRLPLITHEHNQHGGEIAFSEENSPRYDELNQKRESINGYPEDEKKGRLPMIMREPPPLQQHQIAVQTERKYQRKPPRFAPMYRI